jgi:hypothetical protein
MTPKKATDPAAVVQILGSTWNWLLDQLRAARKISVSPPLEAQITGDGLVIRYTAPPSLKLAVTGGSGIAARSGTTLGSGTVTIYHRTSGSTIVTRSTLTAYNFATTAVGVNRGVWLSWWQEGACYVVSGEDCP